MQIARCSLWQAYLFVAISQVTLAYPACANSIGVALSMRKHEWIEGEDVRITITVKQNRKMEEGIVDIWRSYQTVEFLLWTGANANNVSRVRVQLLRLLNGAQIVRHVEAEESILKAELSLCSSDVFHDFFPLEIIPAKGGPPSIPSKMVTDASTQPLIARDGRYVIRAQLVKNGKGDPSDVILSNVVEWKMTLPGIEVLRSAAKSEERHWEAVAYLHRACTGGKQTHPEQCTIICRRRCIFLSPREVRRNVFSDSRFVANFPLPGLSETPDVLFSAAFGNVKGTTEELIDTPAGTNLRFDDACGRCWIVYRAKDETFVALVGRRGVLLAPWCIDRHQQPRGVAIRGDGVGVVLFQNKKNDPTTWSCRFISPDGAQRSGTLVNLPKLTSEMDIHMVCADHSVLFSSTVNKNKSVEIAIPPSVLD